ncbi:Polynucleotide 5'-hydroxyl-kinase grc3 [Pseudocercospora fuligena]|uniref:Polynucleotide 5'-hydroxyl-kinase GRC3 n=1 Tax=Pseudocercospora fuligena TaxID=685502 RepID=A0A8H6RIM7_9PEZI|nr:Polynucleotide 5'-hydroxyl-kinase grc3 [Pseudocercospora fuligena]
MANKRKAREAFGRTQNEATSEQNLFSSDGVSAPQLSAFAAARKATQPDIGVATPAQEDDEDILATKIASAPYDGRSSGAVTPVVLSSDFDHVAAPVPPRPAIALSTFKPGKGNVLEDNQQRIRLRLKADETVTLVGEYDLEVFQGLVTVYGAMLHPSSGPQKVYAPSISALPTITAKKDGTIIVCKSCENRALSQLERLSPVFRNVFAKDEAKGRSFVLLSTTADDALNRSLSSLEADEHTKRVLSRLSAKLESSNASRTMAVGPKSSGKSTFNRLLCNMITSKAGNGRCFYLDLDPGQPEFGPPGQLSLVEVRAPILGPAFTHPASTQSKMFRVIRLHTIAATTFKDDSEHYLRCASDLVRHVPKDIPLVVNSCGWVSGLGADALLTLTKALSISDIVLLEPVDDGVAEALSVLVANQVHRIPRRHRQPGSRSPAELRAMQTMAYFHHKATSTDAKWIAKPLSSVRHLAMSYSVESAGVKAILSYGQAPHPDFLGETIEGAVVAVVELEEPEYLETNAISYTLEENLPYIPLNNTGHTPALDPAKSHCIGLALVQAVDRDNKMLQLLTPISEKEFLGVGSNSIVLVRGSFDSPDWAYQEDLFASDDDMDEDRPWVSRREDVGIEGAIWRLRHPPMAKDVR